MSKQMALRHTTVNSYNLHIITNYWKFIIKFHYVHDENVIIRKFMKQVTGYHYVSSLIMILYHYHESIFTLLTLAPGDLPTFDDDWKLFPIKI
jgi:hypothetical protein